MRALAELMDMSGRRALVTGGAGHVALAAEEALVELGARVVVLDREAGATDARVDQLNRLRSGSATGIVCDLTDEAGTRAAAREATSKLDGLDAILHCAAYVGTTQVPGWATPFDEQTVAAWDAAVRVNLTSAFVLVQEAREALAASGRGSVVLVASTYGVVAPDMSLYEGTEMANPVGYGASKAGVIQLARYLATILAPAVRVNSITPGGVAREGQPATFVERYESRTPLARMAAEEDLKGAFAYLASDLSRYVTGHNLVVDGGWTAW